MNENENTKNMIVELIELKDNTLGYVSTLSKGLPLHQ